VAGFTFSVSLSLFFPFLFGFAICKVCGCLNYDVQTCKKIRCENYLRWCHIRCLGCSMFETNTNYSVISHSGNHEMNSRCHLGNRERDLVTRYWHIYCSRHCQIMDSLGFKNSSRKVVTIYLCNYYFIFIYI
jgi:hypothetical protein